MKRLIAAILVLAVGLQSSGCSTVFPSPGLSAAAGGPYPPRPAMAAAAKDLDTRSAPAQALSVTPPEVPTSELAGNPYIGLAVGVAALAVLALLIGAKAKGGEEPGPGVPGGI